MVPAYSSHTSARVLKGPYGYGSGNTTSDMDKVWRTWYGTRYINMLQDMGIVAPSCRILHLAEKKELWLEFECFASMDPSSIQWDEEKVAKYHLPIVREGLGTFASSCLEKNDFVFF